MEPGEEFGKYRLEALIGRGGGGDVFRAVQRGIGGFSRPVAVKVLHDASDTTGDAVDKLAREARIIGRLQHRNIVQVHEVAQARGIDFLVMELVDGVTLKWLIRCYRDGLPFWLGIHVGVEICRALGYAHQAKDDRGRPLGIIHRDVKPSNVLISSQGDIKLSDFGLAKALAVKADYLTAHGVIKGTPAYMSPEQRAGTAASASADVFSLAMMVCEVCTGKRPEARRSGRREAPTLAALNPAVPIELDQVLGLALSERPKKRPTAEEVGQVLERTLAAVMPPEKLSRLSDETAVWVGRVLSGLRAVPSVDATHLADRPASRPASRPDSAPDGKPALATAPGRRSARAKVRGSDRAEVRGSDRAEARGSDRAEARGSDRAEARGSDRAEVRGSDRAAAERPLAPAPPPASAPSAPAVSTPTPMVPSRDPVRPPGLETVDPERIAQYAAMVEDEEFDVARGPVAQPEALDLAYGERAERTHRRVFALVIFAAVMMAAAVLWQEGASEWLGRLGGGASDIRLVDSGAELDGSGPAGSGAADGDLAPGEAAPGDDAGQARTDR